MFRFLARDSRSSSSLFLTSLLSISLRAVGSAFLASSAPLCLLYQLEPDMLKATLPVPRSTLLLASAAISSVSSNLHFLSPSLRTERSDVAEEAVFIALTIASNVGSKQRYIRKCPR